MERPRSVERLGMKRLGGVKAVKLAIERLRGERLRMERPRSGERLGMEALRGDRERL